MDDQRHLMPLAIQLGQSPAESPLIFTQKDERWLWLTARSHVQCADGTYHEIISHLARTHLFVETFWVATCRTLPAQHPLYELLRPHFTGTIEINHQARNTLIVPGGPIDESIAVGSEGSLTLVGREYAQWSFEHFDPIAQIQARGVGDPELLPGYQYRDDALAIYQIIRTYVNDLLRFYYRSDDDVCADKELQGWAQELAADDGGQVKGLPLREGRLQRFEDLHQIIAQLLFVCSVEHAAVNNGQYAQLGYIPNTPGAMYLPPPQDRTPRSEANFVYALPPLRAVGEQLTLVHLLSQQTMTPLGSYPDGFFQGAPQAQAVVDRLRDDLARAGHRIAQRNAGLEVPYRYLEPQLIGRSISV
ncbi:MAG: lipoxygenase family protein [Pseudomonadota bacterium]|nr:lipoxygenase family protein [Pseudomonadota bacterium]